MVSQKYEISSTEECLSTVTGANNCKTIEFDKTAAMVSFFFSISVLIYIIYFIKNKGAEENFKKEEVGDKRKNNLP
ncbi:hypothetical protein ACMA1I_18390 [Pontibacter sp. 13R65]|uniref:hypothetical protein n=1 Tax=Pontibacter sp. 13R65 TaxID=3127458 RepID=UPI00301BE70D